MRYAVKLLTNSDLTLFESYFRLHSTSKQKGTNLNGDVLAGRLFPALSNDLTGSSEHPVTLDIYGPNGAAILRVRRKIIKPEGGKNWRLNGKLVEAPTGEPERFNALEVGDLAVFGFDGDPLPASVSMVMLSGGSAVDGPILDYLRTTFGLAPRSRSMVALSTVELAAVPIPEGHPLKLLLPDPARTTDIIAAAEDDEEAQKRLNRKARSGATRPVSAAELAAAKIRAQEIGRAGEALFCKHLEQQRNSGAITDFEWTADENATSAWDFAVTQRDGRKTLIDVKSTSGGFDGQIHISAGELEVAESAEDYLIARVFDLEESSGPRLRMSEAITILAAEVRAQLAALPVGVRATKFEFRTDLLKWGEPMELSADDD